MIDEVLLALADRFRDQYVTTDERRIYPWAPVHVRDPGYEFKLGKDSYWYFGLHDGRLRVQYMVCGYLRGTTDLDLADPDLLGRFDSLCHQSVFMFRKRSV